MDLGRICQNSPQLVVNIFNDVDRRRYRGPQEFECFGNDLLHQHRFADRFGLPAEHQDLLHQLLCTFPCLENLLQVPPAPGFRGQGHQREVRIPDNSGQDIVEVVCNPSCQGTDGFQFLSLQKLGFQSFFLRNVQKR